MFMRKELSGFYKKTIKVTAVFKSYAVTSGRRNNLLTAIEKDGELLTDHIWIRLPKEIEKELKKKSKYEFTAEVTKYYKGKKGEDRKLDYCLINCRDFIEIIEEKDEI